MSIFKSHFNFIFKGSKTPREPGSLSRSSFRILAVESEEDRGHWGSKFEFMLSCIGLSVGLGNVWRFPVLAYENGGGAFLIPYLILQIFIGKPMYLMELVMGQYAGLGPIGVWKMNQAARGIGVTMCLFSMCIAIFYNVIMAYTLYFVFASFQKNLPWQECRDEWIEKDCYVRIGRDLASMPMCNNETLQSGERCKCSGKIDFDFNTTHSCYEPGMSYSEATEAGNCSNFKLCPSKTFTPAHFYFYEEVLQRSESLSDMGSPIWYLALCLLLSWVVVFLCLMKGVRSSGKVVYCTATFPYVTLLALLIGSCLQEGAGTGIKYYITPVWSKLAEIQVWKEAAGQMFFSLGVSMGAIIMFGSYNKFKNNLYSDALIISTIDILTSFLAGFVVFATLGAMSEDSGLPIDKVADKGYGLAFVVYPEAMARLPLPQLWSIMFFFMLFTLGLDSEFAFLETILTCLQDEVPRLRNYKIFFCALTCSIFYIIGLSMVTKGGDYVLEIMNRYGATFTIMVTGVCELVAVQWVYGYKRFTNDMKYMLGTAPRPVFFWVFCWAVAAPITLIVIIVYSQVKAEPLKYPSKDPYGIGVQAIGWVLSATILCPIPIFFFISVYKARGEPSFLKIMIKANSPTTDWKPQEHEGRIIDEQFKAAGGPRQSDVTKVDGETHDEMESSTDEAPPLPKKPTKDTEDS